MAPQPGDLLGGSAPLAVEALGLVKTFGGRRNSLEAV
jgi:hypothetical protein